VLHRIIVGKDPSFLFVKNILIPPIFLQQPFASRLNCSQHSSTLISQTCSLLWYKHIDTKSLPPRIVGELLRIHYLNYWWYIAVAPYSRRLVDIRVHSLKPWDTQNHYYSWDFKVAYDETMIRFSLATTRIIT
jgi:hypothetical protein